MTRPESPFLIDIGASLSLTLHEAASRQVDAAIDALQAGDYDVALTLAGAAEGMIERTGHHMFGWLKQHPRALERFDKKEWILILNTERDWLKHGGQPTMKICCAEAAFMIARAASKLDHWTSKMVAFKIWLLANIDYI
ncbi:hypothetical protein NK6_5631 [Bradyrhizobium diazoefficiens]|uniref:Uncharacterized protein n=1 Tax=Bradyrhizobium diazoefficiens TaxID=1355477 RepID=A0A0E4BRA7_9BRAD|nr:hypothetical protein NK6_5631 [Bradyrhizobium diazoefficiens]